jgi:hypothetical protein
MPSFIERKNVYNQEVDLKVAIEKMDKKLGNL